MENKITPYFIRHGLIFGLVNVVLTLFIYFMGASFLADHFILVPAILLLIAIIYPIVITLRFRKMNENLLPFRDAFQISFFVMLISGLIAAIFGLLLYHVIDPDYPTQVMEKMRESLTEFMSRAGVSEEQIEEGLNQNSMAEKFSVMGQIKSFFFSIIFYAIFSLIVAAIAKRNPPMFENKTL